MPHAALWVVQRQNCIRRDRCRESFNAARGFVGGAANTGGVGCTHRRVVSMPHAALWVVQHWKRWCSVFDQLSFNAARGFVGGAADQRVMGL